MTGTSSKNQMDHKDLKHELLEVGSLISKCT